MLIGNTSTISKPRRVEFNGRPHLVVNATMLIPGIRTGDQGPLLYNAVDIANRVSDWNGTPVLLGHSDRSNDPKVRDTQHVGTVFNSKILNGKLVGQLWLDVERMQKLAPQALASISSGNKLELSTGIKAKVAKAPVDSEYVGVVQNIKPDHLALLVNGEKGACGVVDGCGVNNSDKTKAGEEPIANLNHSEKRGNKMPKKAGSTAAQTENSEMVELLVSNCGCTEADATEVLNQKPVADLIAKLVESLSAKKTEEEPAPTTVQNSKEGKTPEPKAAAEPKAEVASVTIEEWLVANKAPEELRQALRTARQIADSEKAQLINNIKGNPNNPYSDDELNKMELDQPFGGLRKLAEMAQTQGQPSIRIPSYLGAGATTIRNEKAPEPLGLPGWDDFSTDKQ